MSDKSAVPRKLRYLEKKFIFDFPFPCGIFLFNASYQIFKCDAVTAYKSPLVTVNFFSI